MPSSTTVYSTRGQRSPSATLHSTRRAPGSSCPRTPRTPWLFCAPIARKYVVLRVTGTASCREGNTGKMSLALALRDDGREHQQHRRHQDGTSMWRSRR
jgi:hypothetical protein